MTRLLFDLLLVLAGFVLGAFTVWGAKAVAELKALRAKVSAFDAAEEAKVKAALSKVETLVHPA